MSGVRVLVGTHKGAFVMTSDAKRKQWDISGPHFTGWEVYHVKGSPADPNRLYASQNTGWFGQVVQRSNDGGKTWQAMEGKFAYDGEPGTHKWYDGWSRPFEFKRIWHFEPSLTDPDTVYAGAEDAALFRSTDGGQSWQELPALRQHSTAADWAPGAGGMCLHTIILDPKHKDRMFVAISAAGAFRSDDAGKSWRPINQGQALTNGLPQSNCYVNILRDAMAVDSLDSAGCTSERQGARYTHQLMREIAGIPSCGTFPRCFPSRCSPLDDPGRPPAALAE